MSINVTQSHLREHIVAVCNPEICLEKMVYVSSISGVWGEAPAANNFDAFFGRKWKHLVQ